MGQVTITLNGRTYRLRCGEGEESRLLDLSRHVATHVDRLVADFGQIGDDRLLLMASLFIADELWDTRGKLETAMAELRTSAAPQIPQPPPPQSAPSPSPDASEPPLLGLPDQAAPATAPTPQDTPDPIPASVTDEPVPEPSTVSEAPAAPAPPPDKPLRHGSLEQRIAEARMRSLSDTSRRFEEN
ncbi:MAG: cell division protein ZapA [Hyphomicrobiaceae bacterium]